MFLAVGLGPGVYAIGIIHLLGHGFFKAALFLSAGSVMHAMNDRIDMRRFGGLWRVMPITFGVVRCAATSRSSASRRSPASSPRTRSSRPRSTRAAPPGYILGICALLGAGITAFYMTRALVMTFFGKQRWEDDVHPHEAPADHDDPDDRCSACSRSSAAYLLIFGGGVQHWLEPSVGHERRGRRAHDLAARAVADHPAGRRCSASPAAYVAFGTRPVPVSPAGRRLAGHHAGPAQPVRRRVQRERADAPGAVAHPGARLLRQPRRRRRGQRPRRRPRRRVGAVAPDADRLRPQLRPVDARRHDRRRRRPARGAGSSDPRTTRCC